MKWLSHVGTKGRNNPIFIADAYYDHCDLSRLKPLQFSIVDICRRTDLPPAILK
jgi:hypothetical protein